MCCSVEFNAAASRGVNTGKTVNNSLASTYIFVRHYVGILEWQPSPQIALILTLYANPNPNPNPEPEPNFYPNPALTLTLQP